MTSPGCRTNAWAPGWAALPVLLVVLLAAERAGAQAPPGAPGGAVLRRDFPCPRCITRLPPAAVRGKPLPVVVVLHGDGGEPARMVELLRGEADRRGLVVLAPACPRHRGCQSGSWWRWAGPPSWLAEQVEAIAGAVPIDRGRIYLVGWSGGASYLAACSGEVPPLFAALGLSGGGMPPPEGTPCSRRPAPVFFLSGDRNPLHSLAFAARDALLACGHEVRWVILPGADHAGEWAALPRGKLAEMLDFFAAHHQREQGP